MQVSSWRTGRAAARSRSTLCRGGLLERRLTSRWRSWTSLPAQVPQHPQGEKGPLGPERKCFFLSRFKLPEFAGRGKEQNPEPHALALTPHEALEKGRPILGLPSPLAQRQD